MDPADVDRERQVEGFRGFHILFGLLFDRSGRQGERDGEHRKAHELKQIAIF